jgi:hypothetical protein
LTRQNAGSWLRTCSLLVRLLSTMTQW